MSEKCSKWEGILYPENMREGWQDEIEDYIPYAFAYCIHDKDKNGHDGDRKTHVHMIVCTDSSRNRTTANHIRNVFNRLSKENAKCCPVVKPVFNISRAYDYLIHDTEKARKEGKYLYDLKDRITGNNFDIGNYEVLTETEKNLILQELMDTIEEREITNIMELWRYVRELDTHYFMVFKGYNSILRAVCEGEYHVLEKRKTAEENANKQR